MSVHTMLTADPDLDAGETFVVVDAPPGHDRVSTPAPDAALFDHFVEARRRARGPIICVNPRQLFPNAAAARLVEDGDRSVLWIWALGLIDAGDHSGHTLHVRDHVLTAACSGVYAGAQLIGALIRVDAVNDAVDCSSRRRQPRSARESIGWKSLRESELGIAAFVASGMTNREIATRLFMSRHTIDFHLRQIFRKLDITSRVDLTRVVLQHEQSLVFRASA
ncbi:MAG: hypothetical protein JWL73_3698 [Actinomycetia bacterium]|nr:hypothetical protein [Actinomycetes bacterium]